MNRLVSNRLTSDSRLYISQASQGSVALRVCVVWHCKTSAAANTPDFPPRMSPLCPFSRMLLLYATFALR